MGINISHSPQMQVLLENATFSLHTIIRIEGIIRLGGIIRGSALYEEIRYTLQIFTVKVQLKFNVKPLSIALLLCFLEFNESVRKVH